MGSPFRVQQVLRYPLRTSEPSSARFLILLQLEATPFFRKKTCGDAVTTFFSWKKVYDKWVLSTLKATNGSYQLCFLLRRFFLLGRLKATKETLSLTTRNCGSALATGCTCILRFCNSCVYSYMQLKSPLYRRGWLIRISERHWCQSQVEVAPASRSEVSTCLGATCPSRAKGAINTTKHQNTSNHNTTSESAPIQIFIIW